MYLKNMTSNRNRGHQSININNTIWHHGQGFSPNLTFKYETNLSEQVSIPEGKEINWLATVCLILRTRFRDFLTYTKSNKIM